MEPMPHRSKGKTLTAEKLDRARAALAEVLHCDEVPGFALQDLERAQRSLGGLYARARAAQGRR